MIVGLDQEGQMEEIVAVIKKWILVKLVSKGQWTDNVVIVESSQCMVYFQPHTKHRHNIFNPVWARRRGQTHSNSVSIQFLF